jgi:hypothetical protein
MELGLLLSHYFIYSILIEINLNYKSTTSKWPKPDNLSSKCECRTNEDIYLKRQNSGLYAVTSTLNNSNYNAIEAELDELVCGVYETLRRGRHQKVIGYSLYGKEHLYTGSLTSRKSQASNFKVSTV